MARAPACLCSDGVPKWLVFVPTSWSERPPLVLVPWEVMLTPALPHHPSLCPSGLLFSSSAPGGGRRARCEVAPAWGRCSRGEMWTWVRRMEGGCGVSLGVHGWRRPEQALARGVAVSAVTAGSGSRCGSRCGWSGLGAGVLLSSLYWRRAPRRRGSKQRPGQKGRGGAWLELDVWTCGCEEGWAWGGRR